jgi:POT family proton-dependent oligopeptide transporter
MFFSMMFWTFFEQAGSSLNFFADRNVARVFDGRPIIPADVGTTLVLRIPARTGDAELARLPRLTQNQLGYRRAGKMFTTTDLSQLREEAKNDPHEPQTITWPIREEHVGMQVGGSEIPASEFQAANPIFILIFGLLFSVLWTFLGTRGWEPGAGVKFALGLFQLGVGFAAIWYGARTADPRGMVWLGWLLFGYLLHTTGELCLSPVGLAVITRLSPARILSTLMGAWFLATAFSQYLAGMIAQLTAVGGSGLAEQVIPPPRETVGIYGGVFGKIALAAIASALLCLALAPLLNHWTHAEAE